MLFFRAAFLLLFLALMAGGRHSQDEIERLITTIPRVFFFTRLTSLWPRLSNGEMKVGKRNPNKDDV